MSFVRLNHVLHFCGASRKTSLHTVEFRQSGFSFSSTFWTNFLTRPNFLAHPSDYLNDNLWHSSLSQQNNLYISIYSFFLFEERIPFSCLVAHLQDEFFYWNFALSKMCSHCMMLSRLKNRYPVPCTSNRITSYHDKRGSSRLGLCLLPPTRPHSLSPAPQHDPTPRQGSPAGSAGLV
jgi:hypothetical protein